MRGKRPPPSGVIAAFGGEGEPHLLPGGQNTTWRAGTRVFKPIDLVPEELEWQAGVLAAIEPERVRVALPVRTAEGAVVVDGWTAREWMDGRHQDGRWLEIIAAGERFHTALAASPMPELIRRRNDPWAIGDRVAWGEQDPEPYLGAAHIPELIGSLEPVPASSQLIHGDLTGNVLFADGLPPAVIDFSPYWRQTAYASAIVVADALIWLDAGEDLLRAVQPIRDIRQYIVRALIYRIITDAEFRRREPAKASQSELFTRAVELVLAT